MFCTAALHKFAAREFTDWTGLPDSCLLAEVTRLFRLVDEGAGLALLGEKKREFRRLIVEGYERPVRIWSDGPKLLMLDVDYPSFSIDTSALLKDLGEPEAKLDYAWRTTRSEKGEWVYPDRGLALFLPTDASTVLQLGVFPRTTMQGYKQNFQLHLAKRFLPKR